MSRFAYRRTLAMAVLAIFLSTLTACVSFPKIFGKEDSEERARQLDQLQLKVMRFADEYVGQIIGPLNTLQAQTLDARERLDAQNWKVSQATAAYTNATGTNPVTGALDMIVLAALSRMVVQDDARSPTARLRSPALSEAHEKLAARAWELSADVLDDEQRAQLDKAIVAWRAANPSTRGVSLVRFGDFSRNIVPSQKEGLMSHGLLGLVGIEPMRGLDPAVRELAQTRQLAQRAIYYAQRAPGLLDMQVERLTYQLAVMPESRRLLEDADRAADAAQRAGQLADDLPRMIEKIMTRLNSQYGRTRALARDLHDLLDAGRATSDSLNITIASVDSLIARFKEPAATPPAAARKPFAIADYTRALHELATASEQLQELVMTLDSSAGSVEKLADTASASVRSLIAYAIVRLIVLAFALAAIIVAAVLVCRFASRRSV